MKTSKTDWKSALGVKSPTLTWMDSRIAEDFLRGIDSMLTRACENSKNAIVDKFISLICEGIEQYPTFHGFHGLESWRRLPIEAKPLLTPPDLHSPCSTKANPERLKLSADDLTSLWDTFDGIKKQIEESAKERAARPYLFEHEGRWYAVRGLGEMPESLSGLLPDASVVFAKHAHWIPKAECGYPNRIAECSRCGYEMPYPGETYCPHCGAEMEDEDDG